MKTCHCCLETKPEENFYHNITSADGWFNTCKKCCKEYQKYRSEKRKLNKIPRPLSKKKQANSPTPKSPIVVFQGPITLTFD